MVERIKGQEEGAMVHVSYLSPSPTPFLCASFHETIMGINRLRIELPWRLGHGAIPTTIRTPRDLLFWA